MSRETGRRIWVLADAHIGHVADGRDGAAWLRLAVEDVGRLPPVDYAIFLGDSSHAYKPEQFREYVRLRTRSGIRWWYEIAGNHDYHGVESGDYARIVRAPLRYTMVDGNLAWVFFSAERGRAAGLIGEETAAWLADRIARYQDRNLIVCSHQLVHGTVEHSDHEERYLHPRDVAAAILRRYRVDLWLAGHYHSRPRIPEDSAVRGGTTFINVGSVSHVYHSGAGTSFVLEASSGSRTMRARCRVHDAGRFAPEFEVGIPFRYPFEFGPLPRRAMPRRR